jgi:single-strand DNA-binding protein
MMATINRVVLVGRLTRDPELRSTAGGTSVCRLRLACNTSWRNKDTGEFDERPNFFDVTVFGASGEACARFLAKGRAVAVDGRLEWHEWETTDGERRQSVGILADSVQFLASRGAAEEGDEAGSEQEEEAIAF